MTVFYWCLVQITCILICMLLCSALQKCLCTGRSMSYAASWPSLMCCAPSFSPVAVKHSVRICLVINCYYIFIILNLHVFQSYSRPWYSTCVLNSHRPSHSLVWPTRLRCCWHKEAIYNPTITCPLVCWMYRKRLASLLLNWPVSAPTVLIWQQQLLSQTPLFCRVTVSWLWSVTMMEMGLEGKKHL